MNYKILRVEQRSGMCYTGKGIDKIPTTIEVRTMVKNVHSTIELDFDAIYIKRVNEDRFMIYDVAEKQPYIVDRNLKYKVKSDYVPFTIRELKRLFDDKGLNITWKELALTIS